MRCTCKLCFKCTCSAKSRPCCQIEERLGAASESLEALLADPAQHNSYDFAFIDADKKVGEGANTRLI